MYETECLDGTFLLNSAPAVYEERLNASEQGRSLKSFQEVVRQNETVPTLTGRPLQLVFSLLDRQFFFCGVSNMQSSAYGASLAGGAFDLQSFVKQPQTILRCLSWVSDSTETLASKLASQLSHHRVYVNRCEPPASTQTSQLHSLSAF